MNRHVRRLMPFLGWVAVAVVVSAAIRVYAAVTTVVHNGYFAEPMRALAGRLLERAVLDGARTGLLVAAVGLLLFAAAWVAGQLLFRDSRKATLGAILAVPLMALLVYAGYEINRKVLPSFFSIQSVLANFAVLAALFLAWCWLVAWSAKRLQRFRPFDGGRIVPGVLAVLLVVVVALPLGLARLWTKEAEAQRPNVLIILVDTLRADRLGSYGYHRDTSPNIDKLAAEGWRFSAAVSQAPWTKPSVASLFTGQYARQTSIGTDSWTPLRVDGAVYVRSLAPWHLTLAEKLASAGFETAAFGHNNTLLAEAGYSQGFLTYDWKEPPSDGFFYTLRQKFGKRLPTGWIGRHFLRWLDANDGKKFFAYLHTLDVHWPYERPAPFHGMFTAKPSPEDFNQSGFMSSQIRKIMAGSTPNPDTVRAMSDAYDECIRHVDEQLGEIFRALVSRGRYDDTLIIVTADHGEEFMDHGMLNHGHSLYDELIHVPLIVKFPCPGPHCGPAVANSPVELVDIFPTVMAATGLEPPERLAGKNLADRDEPAIGAYSERLDQIAMRTLDWKFIYDEHSDSGRLFDLGSDSGETTDLASQQPAIGNLMLTRLLDHSATRASVFASDRSVIEADEETLEGLRALGYIK